MKIGYSMVYLNTTFTYFTLLNYIIDITIIIKNKIKKNNKEYQQPDLVVKVSKPLENVNEIKSKNENLG